MSIFSDVLGRGDLTEEGLPLVSLEVSVDRNCNLKCRMCTPEFSSRWNEDIEPLRKIPDAVSSYYFKSFEVAPVDLDSLLPHLGSLQELVLKGGEPMLNAQLESLLERLVSMGAAPRIRVRTVTNGTVFRPKIVSLLRHFKEVWVTVSVDGADPWFRYIRQGRFTAADVRLNILRYADAGLPIKSILTAFQVYNMLSYDKLVREFSACTRVFQLAPVFSYGLNVQVAPDPLREEAVRRIEPLLDEEWPATSRETFTHALHLLRTGRHDPYKWDEFRRLTRGLDQVRGESLASVDPELERYAQ